MLIIAIVAIIMYKTIEKMIHKICVHAQKDFMKMGISNAKNVIINVKPVKILHSVRNVKFLEIQNKTVIAKRGLKNKTKNVFKH